MAAFGSRSLGREAIELQPWETIAANDVSELHEPVVPNTFVDLGRVKISTAG